MAGKDGVVKMLYIRWLEQIVVTNKEQGENLA